MRRLLFVRWELVESCLQLQLFFLVFLQKGLGGIYGLPLFCPKSSCRFILHSIRYFWILDFIRFRNILLLTIRYVHVHVLFAS